MNNKLIDLTGKRFGYWTVLKRAPNKGKRVFWLCRCVCGNVKIVQGTSLKNGVSKSCGCKKSENHFKSHGLHDTALYRKWASVKNRCFNRNDKMYKHYGERDITMCDEWKNDFKAFYNWTMKNGYKENLELDRIDNDGNYCPENCRYVTHQENLRNMKRTLKVTFKGETKPLIDWCDELNLNYHTVYNRIYNLGWNIDKALGD